MGMFFLPERGFDSQPEASVDLDYTHWLTKDLTFAITGDNPAVNLATQSLSNFIPGGIGCSFRPTKEGTSLWTPDDGWASFDLKQDWYGPNTLIALARVNSVNNPWGSIFSKESTGADCQFAAGRWSSEDVFLGAVNATAVKLDGADIPSLALGFNVLVFTYTGGGIGGIYQYYLNGKLTSTSGATTEAQGTGLGQFGLGRARDFSTPYDSDVDWINVYRANRVLTAEEIKDISLNTRAILKSTSRTYFLNNSGTPVDLEVDEDCFQDALSGSGGIGVDGKLLPQNSTQAATSSTAAIVQSHLTLSVQNSTQANISPWGSITPYSRLRQIVNTLPLHQWAKLNLNSFDDVGPASVDMAPIPGNHRSVIYAWGSFAWDHENAKLILFGGGHANYKGNEVYTWNGFTGLWELSSLPSKIDESNVPVMPVISKDAPQSAHTYSNNLYLKNNKMFCTFGGAATPTGGPFQEIVTPAPSETVRRVGPWLFDTSLSDGTKVGGGDGTGWDTTDVKEGIEAWQHRTDMVDGDYPIATANHVDGAAVYVDEDGVDVVYMTMDNASGLPSWYRYEFGDVRNGGRDTCTKVGVTDNSVIKQGFGVFDTSRGFMYRNAGNVSGRTSEIAAQRVVSSAWNTEDTPINLIKASDSSQFKTCLDYLGSQTASSFYGCVYDTLNDKLWFWDAGAEDSSKPGRVWYATIPAYDEVTGWASTTWEVTEVNPSGTLPYGGYSQGVLGRMKYVPEVGGFIVIDGAESANDPGVWLFKTSDLGKDLFVSDDVQDHVSSTAAITLTHILAADNSTQSGVSPSGEITQAYQLAAQNSTQSYASEQDAITQVHVLAASNVTQGYLSEQDTISQVHVLAVQSSTQGYLSEQDTISQLHILAAQNSTQSGSSEQDTISQVHILAASNSTQGYLSEQDVITQTHILNVDDSTQSALSPDGEITQDNGLSADDSTQSHVSSTAAISQVHVLSVDDSTQDSLSSEGSIDGSTIISADMNCAGTSSENLVGANLFNSGTNISGVGTNTFLNNYFSLGTVSLTGTSGSTLPAASVFNSVSNLSGTGSDSLVSTYFGVTTLNNGGSSSQTLTASYFCNTVLNNGGTCTVSFIKDGIPSVIVEADMNFSGSGNLNNISGSLFNVVINATGTASQTFATAQFRPTSYSMAGTGTANITRQYLVLEVNDSFYTKAKKRRFTSIAKARR